MQYNKKPLLWTLFWIASAIAFNIGVYFVLGKDKAVEFLSGYLVEESLSIDNLFAFILIFSYFNVPLKNQHRVLFWGILCAVIMRGAFIFLGVAIIERFSWLLYILGGILVVTSIKIMFGKDNDNLEHNNLLKLLRRFLPVTKEYDGKKFIVKQNGKRMVTPLFVALLMIEISDFIFAMDSLPAIFSITLDPLIIYSSNIFAIIGLRSLYFVLCETMNTFCYLKYGISAILIFIGGKMIVKDLFHVSSVVTLSFIVVAIVISIIASRIGTKAKNEA